MYTSFNKILNLFVAKTFLKKPYIRNKIIITLLLLLLDLTATILVTYNYKFIINYLSLNQLNEIWINIWLLGIFWILTKTINHIQEIIFFPVINLAIKEVTYKVIEHLHNISLIDYQKLSIPEIINNIRRISISARSFIKTLVLTIIPTAIKLGITIIIAIRIGFYGFLLIPMLITASLILYNGIKCYNIARKNAWHTTDQVIARINDSIINTKVVRSVIDTEMQQIMHLLTTEAKCWEQTNTRLHWIYISVFIILGLGTTLILNRVIVSIRAAKLISSDFILLKTQLISTFIPFKNFIFELRQIAESLIDIKKIIDFLEIPRINTQNIHVNYKANQQQMVYLDNITFSYPNKDPIIENFSLKIPCGEKIIITGKNGSGKSTLTNLISGLYQPSKGKIFIQGQNIKLISRMDLNSKIYCIQQDFRLFNDSLFYNITYGINDISCNELEKILQQFKFMNFINKLPEGLGTIVGEMGSNLSTGEKQKIAIFKAFLIKPDLLILDETTNAINLEDEQEILDLICTYIPTIILVSHRTKILNSKTRIINMDKTHLKLQLPTHH